MASVGDLAMRNATNNQPAERGSPPTPLRVFTLILALVFTIEMGIMLAIARWSPPARGAVLLAVVDALLLTAVLAPALWGVVVRPLRALFEQRGKLLARLFDVQEQERASLARELHDELGQQMTAILLSLRAIEQAQTLAQARERAEFARPIAAGSLDSVRRIARGLAPATLAELGLRAAVEGLCESISATTDIQIALDIGLPERRLPPAVEICVYRAVQEALTNVARHAQATEARVRLALAGEDLELEVSDNGRGLAGGEAEPSGAGLGLQSIRERVSLLGGEFRASSAPGAGTRISARLPGVVRSA